MQVINIKGERAAVIPTMYTGGTKSKSFMAGDKLTAVGCFLKQESERDLDIKMSRHGKISGYKALFTRKMSEKSFLFLVHMH